MNNASTHRRAVPTAKRASRNLAALRLAEARREDESTWKIPSYRGDLQREVDLIEEVVRVYGIGKIPASDRSRFTPASDADRRHDFESELRAASGRPRTYEARTSKLISRDDADRFRRECRRTEEIR